MAYSTTAGVRQVLAPEGSSDPTLGTAASLSDAELEEAIAEADAQVDGRLAGRYTVPFGADPPAIVSRLSRDIAAYLASLVYNRNDPLPPGHPILLRYTRAREILDQAAKGQLDLIGESGPEAQSAEAAVVNPYEGELFGLEDFDLTRSESLGRRFGRMGVC